MHNNAKLIQINFRKSENEKNTRSDNNNKQMLWVTAFQVQPNSEPKTSIKFQNNKIK